MVRSLRMKEGCHLLKLVQGMEIKGQRRRERPKMRWIDSVENDVAGLRITKELAQDR